MFSLPLFLTPRIGAQTPVNIPAGFDWQGHRGCRGLMPENTIPAFLKAMEYPLLTTLELDLAVSKDGHLIVSHEPWFNPAICLKPNGDSIRTNEAEKTLLYQMNLADIQTYDCGSAGNARFPQQQHIKTYKPTLREVVEAVRAQYPRRSNSIRWNIEIKSKPEWDAVRHPPIEEFVRLVVKELRELHIDKSATVQSFDRRALQAMHTQAPDITVAQLIDNIRTFEWNLNELGFEPDIYSPFYQFVSKKMVRKCHRKGIKLVTWTTNDVESMRSLINMGVDGIITDYPNLIEEVGKK